MSSTAASVAQAAIELARSTVELGRELLRARQEGLRDALKRERALRAEYPEIYATANRIAHQVVHAANHTLLTALSDMQRHVEAMSRPPKPRDDVNEHG